MKKSGFILFSFLNFFIFLFLIIFFLDFHFFNGSLFGFISLKTVLFLKKSTGVFLFLYIFLFLYGSILILLIGTKKNIYFSYLGFLLLVLSLSLVTYKISTNNALSGIIGQTLFRIYPFKSGLPFIFSYLIVLLIIFSILFHPVQIFLQKSIKKLIFNTYDVFTGKKSLQDQKKIKKVKKRAISLYENNKQIMAFDNTPDPFKIAKADIDEYYKKQASSEVNDDSMDNGIYEQNTEFIESDEYLVNPDPGIINKQNTGNYRDYKDEKENFLKNKSGYIEEPFQEIDNIRKPGNFKNFRNIQNNTNNFAQISENISDFKEKNSDQINEESSQYEWLNKNQPENDIIIKSKNQLEELPVINNDAHNHNFAETDKDHQIYDNFLMDNPSAFDIDESEGYEPGISQQKNQKYIFPDTSLLHEYDKPHDTSFFAESNHAAKILENTLREFKITSKVIDIQRGPVVTLFKIIPAPGIKLSKISGLADNIALKLAASRVRIVAPIPGERAVGIELPNKNREIVSFYEVVSTPEFKNSKHKIPIALGKDISGNIVVMELTDCPHLLISGATGSGKSVCVNTLISSVLYSKSPKEVKLMLIDPKIVELKLYNDIPHLITPVITDPKLALAALKYMLAEMERRYNLLDQVLARDITNYNRKIKNSSEKLPFIIVIIDELADLMMILGKQIEGLITRLAAMSRAVGIHLVVATQRPSVDVITGLIKANIPSRIAFQVSSRIDSRTILDEIGAEKLIGKGDMLYLPGNEPNPTRIQGAFLVEDEVIKIVEHLKSVAEPNYIYFDEELLNDRNKYDENNEEDDPLFSDAVEIVLKTKRASASYLQRRLKIGYNRAARIIEKMEEKGIIGAQQGSKPRAIMDDGLYSHNSSPTS